MNNFRLTAGDILVNINLGNDPLSIITRWAVGLYNHVFMYLGKLKFVSCHYPLVDKVAIWRVGLTEPTPMLFESSGRGVVVQSLSNHYGEDVVVMRLKPEYWHSIDNVITEAVRLASDPQAYYDYYCVMKFVLPRIIWEKLHLPLEWMPVTWHRDRRQICSEAVLEVFLRAGVPILPDDVVPLPGDFVTDSGLLEQVWCGKLSEEWL